MKSPVAITLCKRHAEETSNDLLKINSSHVNVYELAGLELKIERIVREPTPILFAALHYTMNQHFDMDEMFELLIGLQTKVGYKPRSQQSKVPPCQQTRSNVNTSSAGSSTSALFARPQTSKDLRLRFGVLYYRR